MESYALGATGRKLYVAAGTEACDLQVVLFEPLLRAGKE
jgi:hypothetical protein